MILPSGLCGCPALRSDLLSVAALVSGIWVPLGVCLVTAASDHEFRDSL
jgi:hypothetical protein